MARSVWDQFSDPVAAPAVEQSWDAVSDPVQEQQAQAAQPAAPPRQTRAQALKEGYQKQYSLQNEIGGSISEPVTTMVTGGIGMIAGGLAGIAQGVKNLVSPGMDPTARVEQVSHALTYEPRTRAGKAVTERAGAVLGYPFRKLAEGADAAGDATARATGSPLAGATVNTAIQALPAILTRGKVKNGGSSAGRVGSVAEAPKVAEAVPAAAKAERKAGLASVREKPPALEELRAQKDAAYKRAEETGVVISRNALNRLKTELVNDLKKEGIDKDLHPKASAAVKRIIDAKGQLKLSEIETLRKIANDAKGAIEPADSRLGARIVEKIDDFEASLVEGDVISGNASAATAYKEARALNTRLSKAREINELFSRAELKAGANYTQSGMENALRQEFKALALNKNKMRRFTPEEQASIKRVAAGSPVENALRWAGKFGINDRFGQLFGLGTAASMGPAGILVPLAGTASKAVSTRMTLRNAQRAEELMRRGPANKLTQPSNALMTAER